MVANESDKKFSWKCIVCDQLIPIDHEGDDEKGCLPNLEGGTMEIHFGYGSKFDQIPEIFMGRPVIKGPQVIQAAICDNCFEKKEHLTRTVRVINRSQFVQKTEKN